MAKNSRVTGVNPTNGALTYLQLEGAHLAGSWMISQEVKH